MADPGVADGGPQYPLPGLQEPVEVLTDTFGVPHIYAAGEDDLFRAQGFNVARERLFQLDLWRRRGLGRLAEVFGPSYLARDRAARLFLYRGDLRGEWLAYGSSTKRVVTAFVAGINAFVDRCREQPGLLPVEFRELGCAPARWRPEDVVVIRSHGMFANVEQEVARARMLRDFGPAVEELRQVLEPAHTATVPDGLDLAAIPDDVLDVYRLATSMPVLGEEDLPGPRTHAEGSNNWVVGARHTATGRPLLANDPHRALELPSLRYLAHLSAPGLDVIGGGEPALPGVSIGHNGHVAFGLTVFAIDQEDLYVYRTNPEAPHEYWYAGRWEPMRVVREKVRVRGGEEAEVELRFTRHGPVVRECPREHTAFAVRAAWLEAGMAPYLGSMEYLRARSAQEFVDALNRWGSPGENQVYATPDGSIGWRPAGLVPIRPNWDGTLPVPGDGCYEWAGFHDADRLPGLTDPPEDWIATANEMNLPPGFLRREPPVSYEWEPRFRRDRIAEVLRGAAGLRVADCVRLQADTVNLAARRLLTHLDGLTPAPELGPDPARAVGLLRAWDCDETRESAAAALFQVWLRRHLRPDLLRHTLSDAVAPDALPGLVRLLAADETLGVDIRTDLLLLDRLATDRAALVRVLTCSLAAAWAECRELLGADPGRWRWGRLHHAAPEHVLAPLLERPWVRLPERERPGSGETVQCTYYDADFRQTDGATFRIAIDVGDWDRSLAMNAPGQSGRPESPHWADLYDRWAEGGAFPLLYSRAAVEAHTGSRYRLVPAGTAAAGAAPADTAPAGAARGGSAPARRSA
ncbi:penicillin acylase family protein [Kitasatospora sp. NBC_01302]|uniref:penicillin acylase family protein n=1 Tax=Kitasatospora sp. NBC_01302 TaxID=2903575 RepID=UPI002E11A91A|nr:penicillin acylase family protein [Kitasatospora sp. NBC_01302]